VDIRTSVLQIMEPIFSIVNYLAKYYFSENYNGSNWKFERVVFELFDFTYYGNMSLNLG